MHKTYRKKRYLLSQTSQSQTLWPNYTSDNSETNWKLLLGGPERKRRETDDTERYNRDDPTIGIKQLTTGYRKWAERYISECSGQKLYQHQIVRMHKWNNLLQGHLANNQ